MALLNFNAFDLGGTLYSNANGQFVGFGALVAPNDPQAQFPVARHGKAKRIVASLGVSNSGPVEFVAYRLKKNHPITDLKRIGSVVVNPGKLTAVHRLHHNNHLEPGDSILVQAFTSFNGTFAPLTSFAVTVDYQ